jgi:hypothetical protein
MSRPIQGFLVAVLLVPAVSGTQAPSALTATAATRSAVTLSWTGGDPAAAHVTVERKPLGASWTPPPASAATVVSKPVDGTTFTDDSIDPYATYVYRVRAAGAAGPAAPASNEITVGPPPTGFSQILAVPATLNDATRFARGFDVALDANGDPAVAYVLVDPNNDNDLADSTLHFVSWNRARYRWNAPVLVDTVGETDPDTPRMGLSLARDASTNRLAIAHTLSGDHELRIALSDDGGATWREVTIAKGEGVLGGASLVLDKGQAYLAYDGEGDEGRRTVRFVTGASSDAPSSWKTTRMPVLPGTLDNRRAGISVALDDAGKPAVACLMNPSDGYTLTAALWRPGQGAAQKIADTNNNQSDAPDMRLTFAGANPAVILYAKRNEAFFQNHDQVWIVRSSDGGATWAEPVAVPNDGGNSMGRPVSIAADSKGRLAASAWIDGGNQDGTRCGAPKLLRPGTGTAWTICAPETAGVPTRDAVAPELLFAGNDKLYMAFTTGAEAGPLKKGLVLWRER